MSLSQMIICMYCRSEFQYLAELLWSRTIGSSSVKPDDVNKRKVPVSEQESGSRYFNLPVDFSTTTYSVAVSTYDFGNLVCKIKSN